MGALPPTPSLADIRQQFPTLQTNTYFNYGGQGPLPQVALAAIQSAYQTIQVAGPFSSQANHWITQTTLALKQTIAQELQVAPSAIALTENVSVGCNIALWGIDWQPGDHLLLSDCEHHSVVAAVQELQRRERIEVSVCPLQQTLNGGDPVAIVQSHLRPNTRLVVLSHVLWNTGQVLPLADLTDLCHAHSPSTWVLVDAAQSVGVLPLDLAATQVDVYAFTGHKWWCGPEGVGGLYIRPDVMPELHPTFIGWRGSMTDKTGLPTGWKPDASRYEVATSAYPLYAGLQAAIEIHSQWGTAERRYQRITHLSQQLWQGLSQVPGVMCLRTTSPEAGLVAFQLSDREHGPLVRWLEQQRLFVRTISAPNCLRACVHYLTLDSEVQQLVEAVHQFQTERRR